MSGADRAAIQRIMRLQAPRTTTEFYGHPASHYFKKEIERLSFRAASGTAPVTATGGRRVPTLALGEC